MFGFSSVPIQTDRGEFHCPCCRATRTYERLILSTVFMVFFIPLHTRTDEHLRCLSCDTVFPPGIEALSGEDAVRQFQDRYDRVLVAAMAVMAAGKDRSSVETAQELVAARLQRPNAPSELDIDVERPLELLLASDPIELPAHSRREILSAVYGCAQRQGMDWDENERLGEIIEALGLPPDELVRGA